jgi:tol-pal system protein YbgF
MMKKFLSLFLIFMLVLFSIQWISCASSKPKTDESTKTQGNGDDLGEIERLLGISPQDKEQPKKEKSEDDLLTLLKADEDKGTTTSDSMPGTTVGDPRLTKLQNDVGRLENQLVEKNRTIADLKAQVMMKDEELKSYTSGQKSMPTQTKDQTQYYPAAESSSPGISEYERTYDQGLDLFHSAKYEDAMGIFESLLAQNRNHSLSDNAQYWMGECYYALGNYRAAILAFEKVFTFSQSNKNDYAQYKLGQCYQKLGDKDRAREEFQNLIDNYNNSELIDRAYDKLTQLQ